MKNTIFTAALLALGAAANAQTATDSAAVATTTTTTTVKTYSARNATVDSISAKYKLLPMPGAWTVEKRFPAVGTYQLAGATEGTGNVTVTLDSTSKGIIWISGLPQGTFKAYLAKSPATYRIVSQKSVTGTAVPEGTLVYSPDNNTLQIALGAAYNSENPVAIFPVAAPVDASVAVAAPVEVKVKKETAKGKKQKSKVTFYTASKVNTMAAASSNAAFGEQLNQATQQQ